MPFPQSATLNLRSILAIFTVTTLVACGGGGSSGGDNNAETAINTTDNSTDNAMDDTTDDSEDTSDSTDESAAAGSTNGSADFPPIEAFDSAFADNGSGDVYSSAVNASIISGAVIGENIADNSSLYKSIGVIGNDFPADIEIVHALAVNAGFGSNFAELIMLVRNTGTDYKCDLRYGAITVYDESGEIIANDVGSRGGVVDGSLGLTESGTGTIDTSTCAGPGEIVYTSELLDSFIDLNDIHGIAVDGIASRGNGNRAGVASMQAISYEINGEDVDVTVANQSQNYVNLDNSTMYILNEEGIPIGSILKLHNELMLPGDEYVISFSNTTFDGAATSIRVVLGYDVRKLVE